MADLDFTINADTGQAQRNLARLENNLEGVKSAMNSLKGAIAGLAIGNFITQTINAGIAIKNMSDATGIAASAVNGFAQAMVAAGGSTNQALDGISDLTKNLGEAALGSSELQKSFRDVGVSLDDLRTLSEQDILRKTISGLAAIPDSASRTAIAMRLLGESVKGVNLEQLNRDLDGYITKSRDVEGPLANAQRAQTNLAIAMENFRTATLSALSPLLEFLANLKPEQIEKFVNAVVEIGVALTSIAGSVKILQGLASAAGLLGGAWLALKTNLGLLTISFSKFLTEVKTVKTILGLWTAGVIQAGGSTFLLRTLIARLSAAFVALLIPLGKIIAIAAGVAAGLYLIVKAADALLGTNIGSTVGGWFDTLKEKLGFVKEEAKETQDVLSRLNIEPNTTAGGGRGSATGPGPNDFNRPVREVVDPIAEAIKKQRQELEKSVDAYRLQGIEAEKQLQREIELIGLTEEQRTMKQALFDLEDGKLKELARLQELYNEKSRSGKEEDQKALPLIKQAMEQVTAEYNAQLEPLMRLTQEKLKGLEAEKQRLELETQANALAEFTLKSRIDSERQLRDIQADIAKSTMTEIEKKYYDIQRAAEESARSQIEAENSRRRAAKLMPMTKAEEQSYYDAAIANVKRLQEAEQKRYDNSRSFNTGWKQAFNDYVENATDAAQRAENIFKKATQGMEDALVNFAKTGKFEWKSFVNSLLEELLRSQIQQTIASIFGGLGGNKSSGGGGSLILGGLKSLGSLLGFANGGTIPTNGPVIVGERGPEILTGAAGRTVIPNEQAFGGNVTYNINAVDAMSFKQMIASDPTFLYAVTEQGRRRLPGAR